MYKCIRCGSDVAEPEETRERVPYGESYVNGPAEYCCPFCGGEVKEAKICILCGDAYTNGAHDEVCGSCINIVAKRFSELLKANFTPFEIGILNTAYDGRDLE